MATKRRIYIPYNENGEAADKSEEYYGFPDVFARKCVSYNEREIVVNGVATSLKTEIEHMVFFILQDLIIEKEQKGNYDKIDLTKYGFNISN